MERVHYKNVAFVFSSEKKKNWTHNTRHVTAKHRPPNRVATSSIQERKETCILFDVSAYVQCEPSALCWLQLELERSRKRRAVRATVHALVSCSWEAHFWSWKKGKTHPVMTQRTTLHLLRQGSLSLVLIAGGCMKPTHVLLETVVFAALNFALKSRRRADRTFKPCTSASFTNPKRR